MPQKTPLNALHHALGARMVDFGGWEMPLHYGSQLEEHHAVRSHAGMFDVSHMLAVDLSGGQARAYLRRLLANNVDKLKDPGKALYSCMLNDAGGVVDDLIVYFLAEARFRVVINAATRDKDLAWMGRQAAGFAVSVTPRHDLAMIAVQGSAARCLVWEAVADARLVTDGMRPFFAAQVGDHLIARTGYTGEDGFEISLPATGAESLWRRLDDLGVRPAGLGARDTLRMEAGMNLYGNDMDEATSPLDAGLGWTVDLTGERDFVGRAALLAQGQRSEFLGLVLSDRGVLRAHQTVRTARGEGITTSGGFAPTLERSIAFARLPRGTAPGQTVHVNVRDKWLAARTVKLPFVRLGKALV